MRAILAFALLALLAAPALAKGEYNRPAPGPKPGPHPHPPKPFWVSGAVLPDSHAVDFAGKRITWASNGGNVTIVANFDRPELKWSLVGKAGVGSDISTESLYSVSWAFGAVVKTTINTTNDANPLSVTLFGDKAVPIRAGKTLTLGREVTISYKADRRCDRTVTITVRNIGVSVVITQKYLKPVRHWQQGSYADYLTAHVTITKKPAEILTGILTGAPTMRAVLAFALLALLAAPALAKGNWIHAPSPAPAPKPKPFRVSGAVLANSQAVNFGGKKITWASNGGNVTIVANFDRPELKWSLVGKAAAGSVVNTESLYSVSWAFGAVVKTTINTTDAANPLAVTLFGDKAVPIRPGKTLNLGPQVTISYKADRRCDRIVTITVRNIGVSVVITQKYLKPVRHWQQGSYADYLTAAISITKKPAETLTGILPRRAAAAAAAGREGGAAAAHAEAAAAASGRDARRETAVLGGEDFILSQRSGVEEELFKGDLLGVDADVASVDFRQSHLRSLSHLPAGLEAPPRFLERVAVHYARNQLAGLGALPGQVPLILGIWGPKGVGKTFTLELCLRQMGVLPVCLSAGELEDEWAGEPGRRLRERYAFAARHMESTGEPTCLVISDLDAGAGNFKDTQRTVNTQNLQGELMNLCDNPHSVSVGQEWAAVRPRGRVPVFVTANDLSLLYAPLVREGRMDKWLFEPTREEMAGMLRPLFAPQLSTAEVEVLLDAFPAQPMDFFGAIRSRLVDDAVRRWLAEEAIDSEALGRALLHGLAPPVQPEASLQAALAAGADLAAEQQAVLDIRLSREYYKGLEDDIERADERRQRWREAAAEQSARRRAAAEAAEATRAAAAAAAWEAAAEKRAAAEEAAVVAGEQAGSMAAAAAAQEEAEQQAQQAAAPATASGLPGIAPDELAAGLKTRQLIALDVRAAREAEWGKIKGSKQAPYVVASGSSLAPEVRPNPAFLEAARAALGAPEACTATVVLYGPGSALSSDTSESLVSKEKFVSIAPNGMATVDGQDLVAAAAAALQAAGYPSTHLAELVGGFRAWDLQYRPDGRRRAKGAFRDKSSGELEWWTASN
ncbi:ribulose bisphosphate carboxylase oxygenase activase [Chlorella sorokiniana]|uniref:Ribulose bisphosphate carboxylase/oxygenase activase, chloroplastic n=1 Tax=Chlorella sorokiniana TaxID=3076 RepID=A0A2P6U4J3_CHLSO|nr:ribulose bisphosphate carboxylase oxygenase activase [Chlorella sorokiniana]|eukprot:PRW61229.1 ribulose bisphosphate carboxylase oxygenase activase [Chlorella sorokiniana]